MGKSAQATLVQQRIKNKIKEKKAEKCKGLFLSNRQKAYKKNILLKKFDEDFEETLSKKLPNDKVSEEYTQTMSKFRKLKL